MTVAELLKLVDGETDLVITDGLSDVRRCVSASVPFELLRRPVSFISASDIGGIHLRVVVHPQSWHE